MPSQLQQKKFFLRLKAYLRTCLEVSSGREMLNNKKVLERALKLRPGWSVYSSTILVELLPSKQHLAKFFLEGCTAFQDGAKIFFS